MLNLSRYVEQKNFTRLLMKQPLLDAKNLSQDDVKHLSNCLEADRSPENLFCDGEISRSKGMSKRAFLDSVAKELEVLGQSVTKHRSY